MSKDKKTMNPERTRKILSDTNIAAVQMNEFPFDGKFFLVGKNGESTLVFKEDIVRFQDGNAIIQKPSFMGNEEIKIEPLDKKWQKDFFESKEYEKIAGVFYPKDESKEIYQALLLAMDDAEISYETSVAHDSGYSFNEYLAAQTARNLLEKRYANIEEYSNESGALADRIGLDIATGSVRSLSDAEAMLKINTDEIKDRIAKNGDITDIQGKDRYAKCFMDAADMLGWKMKVNWRTNETELNRNAGDPGSKWTAICRGAGTSLRELSESMLSDARKKGKSLDGYPFKEIKGFLSEMLLDETRKFGLPKYVFTVSTRGAATKMLEDFGFEIAGEKDKADFTFHEVSGIFRIANKAGAGFRENSETGRLEYKSELMSPDKEWKDAKLSENIREIIQMARKKINGQTPEIERLAIEEDIKSLERMAEAAEKKEALGEKERKGEIVHITDKRGKSVFEAVVEKTNDGREIHYKDSTGTERWTEYNERRQPVLTRGTDGFEERTEYDEKGNKVHYTNSNGIEEKFEYNERGHLSKFENNQDSVITYEYNENAVLIHKKEVFKKKNISEFWYNGRGDITREEYKKPSLPDVWTKHEYDENGNLVSRTTSTGQNTVFEYDKDGNRVHEKRSDGYEIWREFDKNGNMLKEYDTYKEYTEKKYDKSGKKTYEFNSIEGIKKHYEYDKKGNLVHKWDNKKNEMKTEHLPITLKTLSLFESVGNRIKENEYIKDNSGKEQKMESKDDEMNEEIEKIKETNEKNSAIKYNWDSFPEEKFQKMMSRIADKSTRNKEEVIGSIDVNGIPATVEILHGDGSDFSESDPEEFGNEKTLLVSLPGYIEYSATVTPNNIDLESYEGFKLYFQEDIIEENAGARLQKDWIEDRLDMSEFTESDFEKIRQEIMTGDSTEREGEFSGRIKAGLIDIDVMVYHEADGKPFIELRGYYPIDDLSMSIEDADAEAYDWNGNYSNALPIKDFYVGTLLDIKDFGSDRDSFASVLKRETAEMLLDEETRLGNDEHAITNSEIMRLTESKENWNTLQAKWIEKQLDFLIEQKEKLSALKENDPEKSRYGETSIQIDGLLKEQLDMYFDGLSDTIHSGDPEQFAECLKAHAKQDELWNAEKIALDALAYNRPGIYHAVCHTFGDVDPFFIKNHLAEEIGKPNPRYARIVNIIQSCKREGISDVVTGMDFEIPYRAAVSESFIAVNAIFKNMTDEEKIRFMGEMGGYEKVKMFYSRREDSSAWKSLFDDIAEECGYLKEKDSAQPEKDETQMIAEKIEELAEKYANFEGARRALEEDKSAPFRTDRREIQELFNKRLDDYFSGKTESLPGGEKEFAKNYSIAVHPGEADVTHWAFEAVKAEKKEFLEELGRWNEIPEFFVRDELIYNIQEGNCPEKFASIKKGIEGARNMGLLSEKNGVAGEIMRMTAPLFDGETIDAVFGSMTDAELKSFFAEEKAGYKDGWDDITTEYKRTEKGEFGEYMADIEDAMMRLQGYARGAGIDAVIPVLEELNYEQSAAYDIARSLAKGTLELRDWSSETSAMCEVRVKLENKENIAMMLGAKKDSELYLSHTRDAHTSSTVIQEFAADGKFLQARDAMYFQNIPIEKPFFKKINSFVKETLNRETIDVFIADRDKEIKMNTALEARNRIADKMMKRAVEATPGFNPNAPEKKKNLEKNRTKANEDGPER